MSTIRVDYDNARAQAKQLKRAAAKCDEIVRQLQLSSKGIPDYWEGASSVAFQAVMNERVAGIRKIGKRAEALAEQIRRVADELEEAERRLKAAAEEQQVSQVATGTGHGGAFSGTGGFGGGGGSGHGF